MVWSSFASQNVPLILSAAFYAVLCVFSIVTGIIYMSGKRELNPVELPDSFVERLSNQAKLDRFARKMGLVTFVVGIVQGITSYAIAHARSPIHYGIALGFTLFSLCAVVFKLKGKVSAFALAKAICYTAILVVLLLEGSRALFFA